MTLLLDRVKHNIDEYVVKFLIRQIQSNALNSLDPKRLELWAEHINSDKFPQGKLYNNISPKQIIVQGLKHLEYAEDKELFIIKVNSNVSLNGTDLNLLMMCKVINYGTLSMPGYPVFTNAFKDIIEHIDVYLNKYDEQFSIGV